jgi:hypothetical protein
VSERQNTIVCDFALISPRISAYEIHEWIYEQISLQEKASMVQIDGPKRHVCIKFRYDCRKQDVLHSTRVQVEYRHTNGEMSMVRIQTEQLGSRRLRIANLPPEVSDGVTRTVLFRYGEVKEVQRRLVHTHIVSRW